MGIRRLAAITVIITFAFGSYSYLINKYNPDTVEFYFKENISLNDYGRIRESNRDAIINMSYIMKHQGNKLIMTTGLDRLTKELKLCKGSFLADMDLKEAVIGDIAAEGYFKNSDVIGQVVKILGEEYKIKGIIKDSSEVYIPYHDRLINLTWQKRVVRCNISDKKHFYLKLENIQNQLEASGVEIIDVVAYREEQNLYRNIVILAAAYVLACYLFMLTRKIRSSLIRLRKEYLENSRIIELHAYLAKKRREVSIAIGFLSICLIMLYVIHKLLYNLCIPPAMVPDNLFSPESYVKVIRLQYGKYLERLENGVDGILVDIKVVNGVFLVIVLSIVTGCGLREILLKKL